MAILILVDGEGNELERFHVPHSDTETVGTPFLYPHLEALRALEDARQRIIQDGHAIT